MNEEFKPYVSSSGGFDVNDPKDYRAMLGRALSEDLATRTDAHTAPQYRRNRGEQFGWSDLGNLLAELGGGAAIGRSLQSLFSGQLPTREDLGDVVMGAFPVGRVGRTVHGSPKVNLYKKTRDDLSGYDQYERTGVFRRPDSSVRTYAEQKGHTSAPDGGAWLEGTPESKRYAEQVLRDYDPNYVHPSIIEDLEIYRR